MIKVYIFVSLLGASAFLESQGLPDFKDDSFPMIHGGYPKSQQVWNDPGLSLDPDEQLSRIPLVLPMSLNNWVKWGGPSLEKIYTVQKGDSLWKISERLFGTPYLWPQIWRLNPSIGNAHFIEPGTQLYFYPASPGQAARLSFLNTEEIKLPLPPLKYTAIKDLNENQKALGGATLKEISDKRYLTVLKADPIVKTFFKRKAPSVVGKIPVKRNALFGGMFRSGERFHLPKIQPGTYRIVRNEKRAGAYVTELLGELEVKERSSDQHRLNAEIKYAYREVLPKDLIVKNTYWPKALHSFKEQTLGKEKGRNVQLVPFYRGEKIYSSAHKSLGVVFREGMNYENGSLFTLVRKGEIIGKAALVDRDRNYGTLYVVDSKKEILPGDYLL